MQTVRLLGHLRAVCPSCIFQRNLSNKQVDLYSILGVKFNAEQKEIKDNFYKLSKEFHPDLNKDNEASSMKFKEIAEAYETLSNPVKRKDYDQTMGIGLKRDNFGQNGDAGRGPGGRRKYAGMKGVFRNGVFVDEEETPQMRNLEYDLSPEKMEKIWARYKSRWERVEEVERMEELKKKKAEFRRRVDLKREKMNNMTAAEKDEFLFRLRLLRTDAGDDIVLEKKDGDDMEGKGDKGAEKAKNEAAEKVKKRVKEETEKKRKENEKIRQEEMEFERLTKEVMINRYGMSEESYNKKMNQNKTNNFRKTADNKHDDVFYEGLDSSKDATDWRKFMGGSIQGSKEKWEKLQEAREDAKCNKSPKYGVNRDFENKLSVYIVALILVSTGVLFTLEYTNRQDFDK